MTLLQVYFPISKKFHKHCEIELFINKNFFTWFKIFIMWDRKTDHTGFKIYLEFIWIDFNFQIYDNRHWDNDTNNWVKYDDTIS